MLQQPWWHSRTPAQPGTALTARVATDVVVMGGGVAGLHAALRLNAEGARVVLLEKSFCGGGMSGLSSGLLTPDSEMGLADLTHRFGVRQAAALWGVASDGVDLIASTTRAQAFECDLQECDSLFVGDGRRGASDVRAEWQARVSAGHEVVHYNREELAAIHPGGYAAGLRSGGTWTIDPFAYCQALRTLLIQRGVQVFEGAEVLGLDGTTAVTAHGAATGRLVVCCANQVAKRLSANAYRQYSVAETSLALSRPLSPIEVAEVFPRGRLQCWDSRLIYAYYRLTGDDRLLVGGGSLWMTIAGHVTPAERPAAAGVARFKRRFPALDRVSFDVFWPGLIDVTRDLLPIAAADPAHPAVFFILGCAGLPWAAWCGDQIARQIGGAPAPEVLAQFGWNRKAFVPDALQSGLGKPVSFALDFLAVKASSWRPR